MHKIDLPPAHYVDLPNTTERVVKVTPEQFETVQGELRKVRLGASSYDSAVAALRSIGIEPVDNTTYRFEVIPG